jgi:hypothetical protein
VNSINPYKQLTIEKKSKNHLMSRLCLLNYFILTKPIDNLYLKSPIHFSLFIIETLNAIVIDINRDK